MKKKMQEKKCALIEKLGVHFEEKDGLAPVAARIIAYLILTGKEGSTFEDLVNDLCASKSTISTHLNHLQDLNRIEYFTKTGDRKKYFILNQNAVLLSITGLLNGWENQKKLHQEIIDYKLEANQSLAEDTRFDLSFHENYITFLDSAINSLSFLKNKIKDHQKK